MPPGGSYTVPPGPVRLPLTASGTYYIIVKTNFDGTGGQYEPDYDNNVLVVPIVVQ